MLIGILGGSFNPVHNGHIELADYICQNTNLDEVWLTLSPLNPLKSSDKLIDDNARLEMLKLATDGYDNLKVCDIELTMPRPSYTIDTLKLLRETYPEHKFSLIIGSDNWGIFDKWKSHEQIISDFGIFIYPRSGYSLPNASSNIKVIHKAPLFPISSTQIRDLIANKSNINQYLNREVSKYIAKHRLYHI